MAEDRVGYRMERIERLLHELRYEVQRGMMEGEINETLSFAFYVPISKVLPDGMVFCEFHTRPVARWHIGAENLEPRLKLVSGGDVDAP